LFAGRDSVWREVRYKPFCSLHRHWVERVVRLTPHPLYLWEKHSRNAFSSMLGGAQTWSRRTGKERNSLPCRQTHHNSDYALPASPSTSLAI